MRSRSNSCLSLASTGISQPLPFSAGTRSHTVSPRQKTRILIVTSSLGSGHASAARAIGLALNENTPEACVSILDYWSLMDAQVAETIRETYLSLVQDHPRIYDRLYQIDQRIWRDALLTVQPCTADLDAVFEYLRTHIPRREGRLTGGEYHPLDRWLLRVFRAALPGNSAVGPAASHALLRAALAKWGWTSLARRLQARLRAYRPDVIIATQMIPAALLSGARARGEIATPIIGVITDFGVHDFWIQPGIDLYCVAHGSIENFDSLPASQVAVTGIPLRPAFRALPSRQEARRALGLEVDQPVVLVPGGGLGIGVNCAAARLLDTSNGTQIAALTGHDSAAHDELSRLALQHRSRLKVWPWTDRMELLLRAADLVVGKPGGLTVAEALACGRPLFPTHSLRGQEGFNVRFLQRNGVGWLLDEDSVGPAVDALTSEPARLGSLQQAAWALGRRDGAMLIAEKAMTLATSRTGSTQAIETA